VPHAQSRDSSKNDTHAPKLFPPLNYQVPAHRICGLDAEGSSAPGSPGKYDNMLIRIGLTLLTLLSATAPPLGAQLQYPVDVAVDADGTVFVADHEAHALMKWDGNGFSVVAQGEGLPRTPLYGIRHIAPSGNGGFIASDPATMKLYSIDANGTIQALPDDDRFVTPWGIAVEPSGNILAVDRVTHRLRRVDVNGAVEDLLEIRAPRAVLFDADGNILVLTDDNLSRIDSASSTPLANDPPFEFPHDAVLHPDGSFYVTDGYARAIWRVSASGDVDSLVQGEPLISPQGLAVDSKGNLLVADAHAKAIFQVTPEGEITRLGQ